MGRNFVAFTPKDLSSFRCGLGVQANPQIAPPVVSFADASGRAIPQSAVHVQCLATTSGGSALKFLGATSQGLVGTSLDDEAHPTVEVLFSKATKDWTPLLPEDLILSCACGSEHSLLVVHRLARRSAEVFGEGCNHHSQLGHPPTCGEASNEPHLIEALSGEGIDCVWAGERLSFARGRRGLLTFGTFSRKHVWSTPTLLTELPHSTDNRVEKVVVGDSICMFLDTRGELWEMKVNDDAVGELPTVQNVTRRLLPPTLLDVNSRILNVSAGKSHFVAAVSVGGHVPTYWAWGANTFHQISDKMPNPPQDYPTAVPLALPTPPEEVFCVECGSYSTLFLTQKGIFVFGRSPVGVPFLSIDEVEK